MIPSSQNWPIRTSLGESAMDSLAVEEPLELRIAFGPAKDRRRMVLTVTMRTPGHDRELALGHLAVEGIIRQPEDVMEVCEDTDNEIRVSLHPHVTFDPDRHQRTGYTTSSCGACGKRSIEAVMGTIEPIAIAEWAISTSSLHSLPERVRLAQPLFAKTGGIHAAALFTRADELIAVREDVGRHNAVDKVLGSQFERGRWPLADSLLFVSGRASFELVQKAVVAGVPILAAVGAPSSLAVKMADEAGLTLCGFVRERRFNVYTKPGRIVETRK